MSSLHVICIWPVFLYKQLYYNIHICIFKQGGSDPKTLSAKQCMILDSGLEAIKVDIYIHSYTYVYLYLNMNRIVLTLWCGVSAILPRWGERPEEVHGGDQSRGGLSALRSLSLLPEHGRPHQDIHLHTARTRWHADTHTHTHTHTVNKHWDLNHYIFTCSVFIFICIFFRSLLLPVHGGMGIRITANEKIRPDRSKTP